MEAREMTASVTKNPTENGGQPDLPPEFCQYRDEGCELSESCLRCPFKRCVYEEPGGKLRWLKSRRAREIARLFTREGKGIDELAREFHVSRRTVQRVLKEVLGTARRSRK